MFSSNPARRCARSADLHWAHTLAGGFRESDTGPIFAVTPASGYKDNAVKRIADLTVDAEGNVTGIASYSPQRADALYWRQVALRNDEEELKKQFDRELCGRSARWGGRASSTISWNWTTYESNLMAIVNVSGKIGMTTGKHFFLPGLFFESRAKHPFVAQDKRVTPIDIHYREHGAGRGDLPSAAGLYGGEHAEGY